MTCCIPDHSLAIAAVHDDDQIGSVVCGLSRTGNISEGPN